MGTDRRAQVWAKTNGHCWYCGKHMNPFEDFTEDHMDPRKQGGGDEVENLQPACKRCNSRKHAKTVDEYRLYLAGKGQLKFWGELPSTTESDIDDEECLNLEDYNRIVRDCLYIGACKKEGFDAILLAFSQMAYRWFQYSDDAPKDLRGFGDFSLETLSSVLGIPKLPLFLSIMYLNKTGIITSSSWRSENNIPFYFNALPLRNLATTLLNAKAPQENES
jgi:HNH endonuclease